MSNNQQKERSAVFWWPMGAMAGVINSCWYYGTVPSWAGSWPSITGTHSLPCCSGCSSNGTLPRFADTETRTRFPTLSKRRTDRWPDEPPHPLSAELAAGAHTLLYPVLLATSWCNRKTARVESVPTAPSLLRRQIERNGWAPDCWHNILMKLHGAAPQYDGDRN